MSPRISKAVDLVLQDTKMLERISTPLDLDRLPQEGQTIYHKLITTLKDLGGGAGLAAPQIGIFKRMFVWTRNRDLRALQVAINPRLTYRALQTLPSIEGCFSIPNALYEVKRSSEVSLSFYTLEGKKISRTFFDFEAIIIQHEIDHLNGRLICHIGNRVADDIVSTDPRKKLQKGE